MTQHIKRYLSILIFFLPIYEGITQEDAQPIAVIQMLAELEHSYDIQFNYAVQDLEGISLLPLSRKRTLEETLRYIQDQTGLIATKVGSRIYYITKKKEETRICGYLRDVESQVPIEGALLKTTENTLITDSEGYFEFIATTPNTLVEIRHLGYKTITRSTAFFTKNKCAIIYVYPEETLLSKVILTSYVVKGITKNSSGSTQIDFSRFSILPGLIETDVLQSVQALPGIISLDETISNINIRGGSNDQNLLLWDDVKMYQSGHFFGLISGFNPQITNTVSIQKNGTNAAYTDGVSGTINMHTDTEIADRFEASVGINLLSADAFVDIPFSEKSSVQIGVRKSLSDFVTTPTYVSFFDRITQDTEVQDNDIAILNTNQNFDFYDTSVRWLYKISDKDRLRLNFINIQNELSFNETANVDTVLETRESSLTQNSIAGGIFYERIWNDTFRTSLQVYETDYTLRGFNANLFASQRFLQENVVSETGIRLQAMYAWSPTFSIQSGYHVVETEITNLNDIDEPLFRELRSDVVRTHGVFSQLGYTAKDGNTQAHLGGRFNYIDKFKKVLIEPRLSVNHQFGSYFSAELLGEFKHQNASQFINFQNDFLGIERRRWQLANDEDIPVIESKQASLGISYNRSGLLIDIDTYYKKVDGITTQSQEFQTKYEFTRTTGSYNAMGVDVLLRKRYGKFNSWLSYSFIDNTYTFNELPEIQFPSNFDITHALTFGTSYNYKNLKVALGLNWRTGRPTTLPVEGIEVVNDAVNYEDVNTSNLDDYLRADFSAMYQLKTNKRWRADIGFSIWNLTNNSNTIEQFFRVDNTATIQEFKNDALETTFNTVFRVYY
ncbi:TonB-dependent receptor [Dokdonia pacifica]|uniref:TonB-dependent Receptor Plug Domain n=1 Tax=Dokdonia pacifica TaxID=1627892 RepID=A0A238ZIN8_9FLAO|nr:TonB-dependent receptor plug domain-containing protein [Dokdonia pacifica]GGG06625.1 TonB-dependent receptor [Dokdonia pacifica]SNR82921.1 TonB-dependent Receptor Plug Domain [Dokdonia pacifica]